MKNIILFLFLALFVTILKSQTPCPNSFKCGDIFIDPRDNYHYPTVQIGSQCWFKANLKATKYVNGNPIPHITDNSWATITIGAWSDWLNDAGNGVIYGHLYNGYSIVDKRGLCPMGWYIPSYNEWTILINYLGGAAVAGGAMKETGTAHWLSPNNATNSSGFTAFGGGDRNSAGDAWDSFMQDAEFWGIGGWDFDLYNSLTTVWNFQQGLNWGYSVRCIKDY